jgi:hypothetical protein
MSTTVFDGTQDYFDSREVIDRIQELVAEWEEATGDTFSVYALSEDDKRAGLNGDDAAELHALLTLQEEADGMVADWAYGETFISADYFTEYARELAENIGAITSDHGWPLAHIDWEAAADALKIDYTEFEFMGTTYYAR